MVRTQAGNSAAMTERDGSSDMVSSDAVDPNPAVDAPAQGAGSVTLVGTAHVSTESADRVQTAIEENGPDVVAVELDEARYRQFRGETPDDIDPSDLLGGSTVFQFLAYWMLSYVQSRMGERFGVEPGADMKAAIEAAETGGYGLSLVDRDIQTTVQRLWARMTLLEKLKLVGGLGVGAADSRVIGLSVGVTIGVLLGVIGGLAIAPLFGVGGLLTLGLGSAALGVIGGLGVGAAVGLFVGVSLLPGGHLPARAIGGAGLGAGAGVTLAMTGVSLPLIGSPSFVDLGTGIMRAVVGGGLGTVFGGGVGGLLSVAFARPKTGEPITEDDVEALTDTDVVTALIEEFRQFSPGGAEALIDERDAYIAHQLVALREAGYDVVAVVGAGHRDGIERYLEAPESLPPLDSLTGTTSGRRFSLFKLLGYAIMFGFVAFFFLLAMAGVQNTLLLRLFGAWFLFNGVFAFTAARLVGATLPSASVGAAIAWLTSINPLLAPGWVAGYVELRQRPVNVADISRLNDLLSDQTRPVTEVVSDMFDVPLFRLIAVVAMTNIGSLVASVLFPFVVLPFFFEGVTGVRQIGNMMLEGAAESAQTLQELLSTVLAVGPFV